MSRSHRDLRQKEQNMTKFIHAFGVNTDIYKPIDLPIVWDVLSVGAFARWKRQVNLLNLKGNRLVVGEIQKENMGESLDIIGLLLQGGVGIMDMVPPETLNLIYNLSSYVYIPADIVGGGERSVLEARACGKTVVVEPDNPKLKELCYSEIFDHNYYATQLLKGIERENRSS